MSTQIPYGLIFLFLWLMLKEFNATKETERDADIDEPSADRQRIYMVTQYFVDDQALNCPFVIHYCQLLGINLKKEITVFTIETAAIMKLEDKETCLLSEAEIHAAANYLLDRCSYMTHLN